MIGMIDSELDATFAALAHPVRRAILHRLSSCFATVNDLADPFEMSLPAISRHIKVLEKAGLISRGQTAQFRPCRLETEPLQAVVAWTEPYRKIWETRFNRMEQIITKMGKSNDNDGN